MNLPSPEDLSAYLDTLLGTEYRDALRSLAKPIDPQRLRDATPASWATPSHEGAEL